MGSQSPRCSPPTRKRPSAHLEGIDFAGKTRNNSPASEVAGKSTSEQSGQCMSLPTLSTGSRPRQSQLLSSISPRSGRYSIGSSSAKAVEFNPASAVRGPRHSVRRAKFPCCQARSRFAPLFCRPLAALPTFGNPIAIAAQRLAPAYTGLTTHLLTWIRHARSDKRLTGV
jgi:hypothetical protein